MMTKRVLMVLALAALCMLCAGIAQGADVLNRFDRVALGPTAFDTGRLNLAPGTAATAGIYFGDDVTLYRSAANTLKTDDSFTVTGTLTTGTLSFTNATASGTWTVTGATTLNGAVTLGDAAGDTITVTGTATVAEDLTLTSALVANGDVTLGDAAGDTITVTGTATIAEDLTLTSGIAVGTTLDVTGASTFDGDVTLGDAATDTTTCTGMLKLPVVVDAGPMTATNGTEGMLVYEDSTDKVYVCTSTGTPGTWAALH